MTRNASLILGCLLAVVMSILPAWSAEVPKTDLTTTRWNIASQLYLLYYGKYNEADSKARIDYAADLGFNAIRFNVWWDEIFPDEDAVRRGGNWNPLDRNVDMAVSRDLKVVITLTLRAPPGKPGFTDPADFVLDAHGVRDSDGSGTTRLSYASPRIGRMIRFVQEAGERYRLHQNAGHILAIAPLVTREAEIPYAHDRMEDYNPLFVHQFRTWLAERYGGVEANQAISPPQDFAGARGRDWWVFRDLKARQFVDSCCAALAAIPGVTTPWRVLLDYGNVGDTMAWKRGSLGFVFHAQNPLVWGIKQNDAHDYDHRYTGSLLGSNARRMGKTAFNEWFYDADATKYPSGSIIHDSVREIREHYEQGMNGVSYIGILPGNTNLEAIVRSLKEEGVWAAPVTEITPRGDSAVHMPYSEFLNLQGWGIKERYFDLVAETNAFHVNLLIDDDLSLRPLPVLSPSN